MRRRERFVIAALVLGFLLIVVQYIPLELRYLAIGVFTVVTYFVSAWALKDDLQLHEWLTILPFPALYASSVGLFYFLLPNHFLTRFIIFALFSVGMYAVLLASNIFSVAKGRTIQLLHAAQAISLLFTLLISLFFSNTIFSLHLPFYWTTLLIAVTHFPLVYLSLWSVELSTTFKREVLVLALLCTLLVAELALILTFIPFSLWYQSLFIMSFLYIGLGILGSHLRERLFFKTLREYGLVAGFVVFLFLFLFPLK
ncbi:MAG: hypothetical protein H6774_04550 [Pseudomonadales bacterium]|nr:hypothetical protein [Pseudomonadales bacterium]